MSCIFRLTKLWLFIYKKMKKKALITIIISLTLTFCNAQFSNRLGIGLNYVALDAPDDLVFSPQLKYEHIIKKRIFVNTQIGYINYHGTEAFFDKLPQTRNRINFDTGVKFAIIKYKNNYLKLGGGVSIWRRNDKIIDQIKVKAEAPDFVLQILSYNTKTVKDWNLGYNIVSEIDISVSKKVSISGSFGVANFKNAGLNSFLGLTGFYKF